MNRLERRAQVLFECGASVTVAEALLAYTAVPDYRPLTLPIPLPLSSEPHLVAWEQYAAEAEEIGAFPALQKRLVQLRFPIRKGISESEAYQRATQRGDVAAAAEGLALHHPDRLQLRLHPTLAGTIPVLWPHGRHDFVALIQAFAKRNEPEPIPEAMGAGIITGHVNWDRLHALRQAWKEPGVAGVYAEAYWQQELRTHILPRKQLYQDTFIILSDGVYSGVTAEMLGLPSDVWQEASQTIRLEHECTHYLTRRFFSSMRTHLLDELIADLRGITAVNNGYYSAGWFLAFMGLDAYPRYRENGRLALYREGLPDDAFAILQQVVRKAAVNLQSYYNQQLPRWQTDIAQIQLLFVLSNLTLEELASAESHAYIEKALNHIQRETGSRQPHVP